MADLDYNAKPISANEDNNAVDNVIFFQLSDGTAAVGVTSGALDVNIDNASIVVTATDLDIRDLVHTQDSIELGDGTNLADFVVINSAFGATPTAFPVAGKYEATPTTYGDGDAVPFLTDVNGKLVMSNPGGTEYTEDAVAPAAADGNAPLGERIDTPAAITPAAGDWSKFYVNANGSQWVAVDGTVEIVDGGNSITVDAIDLDIRDLTHVSDSVAIGDGTTLADVLNGTIDALQVALTDGTDQLAINTDGSINVNLVTGVLSDEYHVADIGTPLANATDTHTVTASGGVMLVTSITVSGSGGVKYVAKNAGTEVMTGFLGRDGNTDQILFDPAVEVADAAAFTIERTNRQNQANDVYSSVFGRQL